MSAPRKWTVSALETETGIASRIITNRLAEAGIEPTEVVQQKNREVRYYRGRDVFPALYGGARDDRVPRVDRLKELKVRELELDIAEREARLRSPEQIQDAIDALAGEVVAQSRGFGQSLRHELGLTAEAGDAIQSRLAQLLDGLSAVEAHLGSAPGPAAEVNGHGVGRQ